jgi:hypothetical protein
LHPINFEKSLKIMKYWKILNLLVLIFEKWEAMNNML